MYLVSPQKKKTRLNRKKLRFFQGRKKYTHRKSGANQARKTTEGKSIAVASDRYGEVRAGLRCRSADCGLVLMQRQPAEQVCAPLVGFCVSWFRSLQVLHIRCSHLCYLVS